MTRTTDSYGHGTTDCRAYPLAKDDRANGQEAVRSQEGQGTAPDSQPHEVSRSPDGPLRDSQREKARAARTCSKASCSKQHRADICEGVMGKGEGPVLKEWRGHGGRGLA